MKDFDEQDIKEDNKKEDNLKKESFYAEADENIKEGTQENKKGPEAKGENNGEEEKLAEAQKEDNCEKEKDACKEDEAAVNPQPTYSSTYQPPYYVPNFTVIEQEAEQKKTNAKKKSKAWIFMLIASVLAVIVLFVAAFGFFSYILSSFRNSETENSEIDMQNEQINIVQNSPQLEINKSTDSSYVPQSLPEVVSKVGNSVVEISTSSQVYDRFYGQYVTSGAGSGVIITQSDEAGYLITNYHVIHNTDGSLADTITVILTNGEEYEATRIGSDSSIDLAVLRIEKKADEKFTVASFGDSKNLVVGQDVIAIGNPLGSLGGTVTDGIISALDRRVKIDGVSMVLLQHNAAINPGNSGGGLFDIMGNLVGVVNAKKSSTGIEGLGFAIPSNIVLNFFNRVMIVEPALGIKVAYGRPSNYSAMGVYVVEVSNSDFKVYDRIAEVNGEEISNAADYYAIIDAFEEGDTAVIRVERNSKFYDITVVLGE